MNKEKLRKVSRIFKDVNDLFYIPDEYKKTM